MIVELNASSTAIQKLLTQLDGKSEFSAISNQLQSALAQNNDDQTAELPREGDHEKIDRME